MDNEEIISLHSQFFTKRTTKYSPHQFENMISVFVLISLYIATTTCSGENVPWKLIYCYLPNVLKTDPLPKPPHHYTQRDFPFSALKLHSPIHISYPLDDIHKNCDLDIKNICSHVYSTELDDTEYNAVSNPSSFSFEVDVNINTRNSEESVQKTIDNTRFLDYGRNTDKCLWNAFDAKQVSKSCASALMVVNNSTEDFLMQSDGTDIHVSISLGAIVCIAIYFIFIRKLYHEKDSQICDNDEVDYESYEYHALDESKNPVFIAVPLEVI